MIRIAVDARALEELESLGVARYLRNILQVWDRAADPDIDICCYTRRTIKEMFQLQRLRWRVIDAGRWGRKGLLWQNSALLAAICRDRSDVLWSPYNLAPLVTPCPLVVTIHDVSFAANPFWFGPYERKLWGRLAWLSARRAAAILTISHFSRREIAARLGTPADSTTVTPLAVDPTLRPADEAAVAEVRERLDLRGPYILYVGALFARRNILPLLDGFQQAATEHPDWQLLLIGPNRHYPPIDIDEESNRRGLCGRVHHVSHVSEADLAALYTDALVFIYPSSYEGFGLPVLEALAYGLPVVTGNATSLPEVAGDAALLVEPSSARAICGALVLAGSQVALRAELRRRGLLQAMHFSWERTAAATLDVLRATATRAVGS